MVGMRTSMAMAWAPVEAVWWRWAYGVRLCPRAGGRCVVRGAGPYGGARRGPAQARWPADRGVVQIALERRHRSTCRRATSSEPGVLSLTSWATMRSSYRFPVGDSECDLTWWMMSVRGADITGHRGSVRPSTGSGRRVRLDDPDLLLGDLAVHDPVRAELEGARVVGVRRGDQDVVGAGLVGVRDVGARWVRLGRRVRVV